MIPKGIDVSGYYRANLRLNNRINFQKGVVSDMKKDKLDITYPCEWDIKVIGATEKLIRSAIDSIIKDRSYIVSHSRTSKAGKYISLNIKLTLLSEKEKHDLYTKLSEHKDIKFVLQGFFLYLWFISKNIDLRERLITIYYIQVDS